MAKMATKSQKESLRPLKRLGQVFLKDKKPLLKMIEAAQIRPEDIVLEIGPGPGNLTELLLKTGARVLAVEKDQRFVSELKKRFKNQPLLKIISADIRDLFKNRKLPLKDLGYKVVANIPYYLTNFLFRLFYERGPRPEIALLMVQKEVGQRIIKQDNFLSLMIHYYAQPQIIAQVKKGSFWPKPKVDSLILKLQSRPLAKNPKEEAQFFNFLRQGFGQPRKMLKNNLKPIMPEASLLALFKKLKISPQARPSDLNLSQWQKLYRLIY